MRNFWMLTVTSLLLLVAAAEADIDSGPKPGEKAPALKVDAVIGAVEGKEVDYVKERADKLTVYVFVQAQWFDRPIGRYLVELDKKIGAIGKDAYIVAVWLTDDLEKSKAYLPRMNKSIKLATTALTCSLDGTTGPADWAINERAHLTTIVVKDGKVIERFAYQSTNDTDVPEVEEVVKKAAEKKE